MRVLFIVPPYVTTDKLVSFLYPLPLGPLSVAAYLRERGYEVSIKDFVATTESRSATEPLSFKGLRNPTYVHFGYDYDYIDKWIEENINDYDIVGVSALQTPVFEGVYEVIKIIKKHTDIPVVAGGPHPSTRPDEFLEESGADSVVIGEGEEAFRVLLEDYKENNTIKKMYREDYIEDLDSLPFPAWDLIDFNDYPKAGGKLRAVISTSRSCPFECTFCSVHTIWGRKWRAHSPLYVLKHIMHLYRLGVRQITIIDDNFLLKESRAIEILKGIIAMKKEKKLKGVSFLFEEGMQVTHGKDRELVKHLYEAGFKDVRLGLESLSSATLEYMKKPMVVEDFRKAIEVFEEFGYVPRVFYILGFKTDTVKSMIENVIDLSEFDINIRANNLKIYPNTDMHKEYLEEGLIDETYDWRMSTFYTPPASDFTMEEISRLKAVLSALEFCSSEKINVFTSDFDTLMKTYKKYGYEVELREDHFVLKGNPKSWRVDNSIKAITKILAMRFGIVPLKFYKSKVNEGESVYMVDDMKSSYFDETMLEVLKEKGLLLGRMGESG